MPKVVYRSILRQFKSTKIDEVKTKYPNNLPLWQTRHFKVKTDNSDKHESLGDRMMHSHKP